MKKSTVRKCRAVLLLIACFSMLLSAASAGTSIGKSGSSSSASLTQQLDALSPFKFANHKRGIGYGSCPVYSAPSLDSYRGANGKATVATNSDMAEAGYVSGWLMVRYETNNGGYRVGYIPPKYVKNFKSSMAPHFGYIPVVAQDTIYVTDNPMRHGDYFAVLDPGESFHILSKYNYYRDQGLEWWYIECTVDGKIARGFIEMSDSRFGEDEGDG